MSTSFPRQPRFDVAGTALSAGGANELLKHRHGVFCCFRPSRATARQPPPGSLSRTLRGSAIPQSAAASAIDLSCLANHALAHGGSDANRHDVPVPTQGPGPGGPPRYHHRSATPRTGASAPLAGCAHRAGRRTHVSSGGVGVGETASAARFRSGGLTVGAPVPATSSRPCLQQTCHAKCSLRAPGSPALSSRTRPCSSTTSTTTASLRGFAACPRRANCSNRSGTSTVRGLSTSNA